MILNSYIWPSSAQKSCNTSELVPTILPSSTHVRPMSSLGQHFSQISILDVLPHPAANHWFSLIFRHFSLWRSIFFALMIIFTADHLVSSPFSIKIDSLFILFLCCVISLQDSISIFSKNPAYLWFFHQKQKFDSTCHQQPEKIGVKNALRFLLKKTKIFNFRASDTLFPLHHVFC